VPDDFRLSFSYQMKGHYVVLPDVDHDFYGRLPNADVTRAVRDNRVLGGVTFRKGEGPPDDRLQGIVSVMGTSVVSAASLAAIIKYLMIS
jgi:hypothetical protein